MLAGLVERLVMKRMKEHALQVMSQRGGEDDDVDAAAQRPPFVTQAQQRKAYVRFVSLFF